jgi:hypothetical protein
MQEGASAVINHHVQILNIIAVPARFRYCRSVQACKVLKSESVHSPNSVEAKVLYDDLILTMWLSDFTAGSSLA